MPPRTRSNRAALTELESLIAAGKPVNSTGFASLPNELYSEIVSHIPKVPVSCHTVKEHEELTKGKTPSDKFDRHCTLYSLSQTCRALRQVFLRYLWETIEVYDGFRLIDGRRLPLWSQRILMSHGSVKLKLYAEELLRQLEVVTVRNASLAQHVKSLNIILLSYSIVPVFIELLRCIPLLPNLTTVRLITGHQPELLRAYRHLSFTYHFHQVRHVYVDMGSSTVFPSMCPNLVTLSLTSDVKRTEYRAIISSPWAKIGEQTRARIEVLGSFCFYEEVHLELCQFSNLKDITLEVRLAEVLVRLKDTFDLSDHLKRLQIIRIRADQLNPRRGWWDYFPEDPEATGVENWVKWAEGVLRRIQRSDKQVKKVYLTVHGGDQTQYLLEPGQPTKPLPLPTL